jgi:hypothetical protein
METSGVLHLSGHGLSRARIHDLIQIVIGSAEFGAVAEAILPVGQDLYGVSKLSRPAS